MNLAWIPMNELYCAGSMVAIALLQSWTSRMNQFFFFSRTVPAGFEETGEARAITLNYRLRIWLGVAPAVMAFLAAKEWGHLPFLTSAFVGYLVQWLESSTAFALAHRAVGRLLSAWQESGEVLPERLVSAIEVPLESKAWSTGKTTALVLLAPVAAAVAWGAVLYGEKMGPTQLGDAMEARHAGFLCGFGVGLLLSCTLLYVLLRFLSRHRTAMGGFTAKNMAAGAWIGAAALIGGCVTVPLHLMITHGVHQAILISVVGLLLLRVLYAYSKKRLFVPAQVERNGDEYWRFGMFYCNPADPTLFIQHRCGPGYTLNFANFLSWPLTVAFVADLVFLAVMQLNR